MNKTKGTFWTVAIFLLLISRCRGIDFSPASTAADAAAIAFAFAFSRADMRMCVYIS